MSGSSSTNNILLTAIISTIQNLQTQTIPQPNTTAAQTYQFVNLAPLESNGNPTALGLTQLFQAATINMQADLATIDAAILAGQIPNPALVINLSTPLHDAWASFQVLNYLLYLSAYLGYPGPAAQFFAPIIPSLNAQINPAPIIVPQPSPPQVPNPPPAVPTPTPVPSPPSPTPSPPTPSPPSPTPSPPPSPPSIAKIKAGKMNDYSGSGEPGNGSSLISLLGLNTVVIPVNAIIPTQTSVTVNWNTSVNDPSQVGGLIDQITLAYQSAGLNVMLELVVDCADGTPRSQFFPTSAITFLTNLRTLAVTLAQNATRLNCSAISIAPQLFPWQNGGDNPADYQVYWDNIYSACKSIFSPTILYVASPLNVGPIDAVTAMSFTNSWDAIGVKISPPIGTSGTSDAIQAFWSSAVDTEALYNAPIFGSTGWITTLANAWKSSGKLLYIESGFAATAG